jgi:hypothetical protein
MATVRKMSSETASADLTEFRRLKAKVAENATAKIADNIERIAELLRESAALANEVGIQFSIAEITNVIDEINDSSSGWNSSNCY